MVSKDAVLILTREYDPHADMVMHELQARNVAVMRFDPADFPLHTTLIADNQHGQWNGSLVCRGEKINLEQIASIWYRRPSACQVDESLEPHVRRFAEQEARWGLGGLLRSLKGLWVNHPEHIRRAEYKPRQLQLASDYGFDVPRTLITNDPGAVLQFFEECGGEMIYKTLRGGMLRSETDALFSIYTSRVDAQHLRDIQRVKATAHLFQEYIPKSLELRITIIGESIFAAEIYSQHSERTKIDWRRAYPDLRYGIHQLPAEVQARCLHLVRHLDLEFAALDMIVTPDGRYIFLEINPNGQWGWIEDETGLPLCETLVDLLTIPRENIRK